MNSRFIILFSAIFLSFFFNKEVNAQNDISQQTLFNQIYSAAEQEYDIDQLLVNGVLYERLYLYTEGHPYLLTDTLLTGSVVYRGKQYNDLFLIYDICNQQLLVNYAFNDNQIVFYLPQEFISEFNIENKKFVKRSFPGKEINRIYQIIGGDYPIKILYFWEKFGNDLGNSLPLSYKYTTDMKNSFIHINGGPVAYKRNGSFVRKFPKSNQKLIKKYIRENRLRVKFSSDNEMDSLIKYCNSLNNYASN